MGRRRDRASAEGLLPRMESRPWSNGKTVTYRYHPVGAKPVNLGTDRIAAIRKVLDLLGQRDSYGTLQWVWEKFTDRDKPAKRWSRMADGTRTDYRVAWKQIEKTFGAMQISDITQPMVARYVHIERASATRRADIEKSLLSLLFGHGILLGVCNLNAAKDVPPHGSEPRTEAPSQSVLAGFLDWIGKQTPQRRKSAWPPNMRAWQAAARSNSSLLPGHR